jgi:transcriptional regulator with XRE-family HTH domain
MTDNNFSKFMQEQIKVLGNGSMRETAKIIGVSHSTIARYINNVSSTPSISFLSKVSKATNISLTVIMAMFDQNDLFKDSSIVDHNNMIDFYSKYTLLANNAKGIIQFILSGNY